MDSGATNGESAAAAEDRPTTILVVEDEFMIRILISDGLREEGYSVIEAMNGDEAVGILDAGIHVDLIVSDVHMPGRVDGLNLLGIARQRNPMVPFILTSGHLDGRVALMEGATHFLGKPFRIDKILGLVASELAKTR